MSNPSIVAFIVSEIKAFMRTDGQEDMAISTRLVILTKNIYTSWVRKRFLLPVTYFPTNLVHPFTLRLTVINRVMTSLRFFVMKVGSLPMIHTWRFNERMNSKIISPFCLSVLILRGPLGRCVVGKD